MDEVVAVAGIGVTRTRAKALVARGPRTRFLPGLSVLVGLVGLGLSCGDSGGAGSQEAFVASYCDLFIPCCAKAGLRSDGTQCKLFLGAFAPQGKYDKQAGEACLAEAKAASSKADFCDTGLESAVCDKVFGEPSGSKKPGETCESDSDCAASSEGKVDCATAFSGSAQIRKCQVQVRGKAGDQPCVGTVEGNTTFSSGSGDDVPAKGYLCYDKDGLRCDSKTNSCLAYKAVGEACISNGDCVSTTYCDSVQDKCAERKAVGAACSETGFSSDRECVVGNYCSTAKTCMALIAEGGACTSGVQCLSGDCVNSKCGPKGASDFGLALICGTK
jgi:hypothetical protein